MLGLDPNNEGVDGADEEDVAVGAWPGCAVVFDPNRPPVFCCPKRPPWDVVDDVPNPPNEGVWFWVCGWPNVLAELVAVWLKSPPPFIYSGDDKTSGTRKINNIGDLSR